MLVPGAIRKIAAAGVRDLIVTDSTPFADDATTTLRPVTVSVAPLIATAIHRLLEGGSLRELA